MGNCQVSEVAAVVIQHPGGRMERLYWPTSAGEVMKSHPGHYIAIVTLCTTTIDEEKNESSRYTRVRLLKPSDILILGQVYRLVSSQDVNKALQVRKHEKMKKTQSELMERHQQQHQQQRRRRRDYQSPEVSQGGQLQQGKVDQALMQKGDRERSVQSVVPVRVRQWRPSLHSISEVGIVAAEINSGSRPSLK